MVSKYFEKNSLLKTEESIWRKTNAYIIEKVKIKSHLKPQDTNELCKYVCVDVRTLAHMYVYHIINI